jgi:putative transposon-encoded protein
MGNEDNLNVKKEISKDEEKNQSKVKFEVYGEEMMEKVVKLSGNSGRIYLPPDWVGHKVKIIKVD